MPSRRTVVLLSSALALLLSVGCSHSTRDRGQRVAAGPGYSPGTAYPSAAPSGKHYFEGLVEYRGVHGKPPGEPFDMRCWIRREDLRCDITSASNVPVSFGFRGPGNTLCFKAGHSPVWVPLSLATVGFLFSLLPPHIRQQAVNETQAQYRWTGRTDSVLGRSCRELEDRSEEGVRLTCYSPDEYFEVDQKLVPIMHQMGFDPGFVSSLSDGGLGWRSAEWDKNGTPRFFAEAVRIDPQSVNPAMFSGVCGMP